MNLHFEVAFDGPISASVMHGQDGDSIGPDGVVLQVRTQFVKPGKGKPFVRAQVRVVARTQVRCDVVAAWLWSRRVTGLVLQNDSEFPRDVGALASLIASKTQGLPPGRPSDPPDEGPSAAGSTSRIRPRPSSPSREALPPKDNDTPKDSK